MDLFIRQPIFGTSNTESIKLNVKTTDVPPSRSRTGYGFKIPTQYKVNYFGKWLRVYARCISNTSTLFIESKRIGCGYTSLIVRDYP